MTKSVKVLLVSVLLLFIGSVIAAIIIVRKPKGTYVEIVQNNEIIYSFDLSEEKNRTFRIEGQQGGWNEVRIEDGKISITDADCPDHTCVKAGVLRSENIPIVCLPHKLVIRFADKEQK